MRHRFALITGAALLVNSCGTIPIAQKPLAAAIVTQIDHVMIVTNERDRLEALFSDTLRLPVVWPATASRGPNTFVGIAFGDVHLELVPRRRMTRTELNDFAFQPVDIATAPDSLRARGLAAREPDVETNDAGEKRWTIIGFRHAFQGIAFFVIEYQAFDTDERRARFEEVVRQRRGGPLGVQRIREFRLAYPADTLPIARQSWHALLGSHGTAQSTYYQPAHGPAIRLIEGSGPEASSILVEVASLTRATAAARSLGMLQSASADSVALDPRRFGGLRFILVEKR